MEKRRTMSCVATMIGMNAIDQMGASSAVETTAVAELMVQALHKMNERGTMKWPWHLMKLRRTSSDVDNVCMECKVIPTNHMCLKCKVVPVCACCCDENCGLRNNIWCKWCFENKTSTNHQIIWDGDGNCKWKVDLQQLEERDNLW